MTPKIIFTILAVFFFTFNSFAQVTITTNSPNDICGGWATLDVVNPQAGFDYAWYVNSNTCSGTTPVPMGPMDHNTTFNAYFTGLFYCIATDPGGNQTTSNSIQLRILPGSMSSTMLPIPYPSSSISCQSNVSLCVPTDFYQNFTTTIKWYRDNVEIPGATSPTYSSILAGWYKYSITSSCMTDYSDSVEIINSMSPPVISGDTTICQGASSILFANPGFSSYLWSTGETTQTISVNTAGTYTVTVSNAAGCTASDFVVVSIYPNPVPVIIGDNSICQGQTTVFDAGSGYLSYIWSNGNPTQTIVVGVPGPYTVTVTDNNGCVGIHTRVLTVIPLPIPQITGDSTLCLPQTSILNASGGFPGFASYFWSNGVFTQSNTVSTIGTYTVTVTDNNGCTGSDSIQVTGPYATISGDNSICSGNSTDLIVSFTGNPPFAYSYHDGTTVFGPFATSFNPAIIPVSPGTNTTYTLLNYGDANCSGNVFGSATITMSNPAPVITGDSTICPGQITVLDAGTGYAAYFWSTGDVAQTTNVGGIGTYSVTVVDASGCTGTDSFTVMYQPPYPTVLTASGPLGICQGDSVQLFAQTPMNSYLWYKNDIPISGATTSSLWVGSTGRYKCLSMDASSGCAASNQVRVAVVCFPPPPPVDKTSQESQAEEIVVNIFPNPASRNFTIEVPDYKFESFEVQLFEVSGKLVRTFYSNQYIRQLNVSLERPGFYIAEIRFSNNARVRKPVIVH